MCQKTLKEKHLATAYGQGKWGMKDKFQLSIASDTTPGSPMTIEIKIFFLFVFNF